MAMTSLRAEELLCDTIVRRGGDPWAYTVCREWGVYGQEPVSYEFALPLLSTKRPYASLAVIDLLATNRAYAACIICDSRELRCFLSAGFPVACETTTLLVGLDDTRFLSTDGWISDLEDIFVTKPIALSSTPTWTTSP